MIYMKHLVVCIVLLLCACSSTPPTSKVPDPVVNVHDMPSRVGKSTLPPTGMYCACIDPVKKLEYTHMCKQTMETVKRLIPDAAVSAYYNCNK